MLLLIFVLVLLIISGLIITPVIWCGFGKIFRIEDLTFKKALLTCLLLTLIGVAFQIIPLGLTFLKINNVIFDFIISIAGLVVAISILKVRFNTTVLKSIGLYVSTIVFAVCLALLIRTFVVQAFKIPSGAMKQSILVGDHILVNKLTYDKSNPMRGDIVIFPFPEDPSKDFIKRIVAMGGETIVIVDKKVMINGNLLQEPYVIHSDPRIIPKDLQPRDNFGPTNVPEDSLFVMGDNRDHSYDSRFWGLVERAAVKGKAINIYWSWDKESFSVRWDRIGKKIE